LEVKEPALDEKVWRFREWKKARSREEKKS
jgi:hypothetical protein